MKPYAVVRVVDGPQLYDLTPPREITRATVYANVLSERSGVRPQDFSGDHPVYFTETLQEGETLASALALKTPGIYWVVCKSTSSFRTTPGPISKAVFSDAGMFPA